MGLRVAVQKQQGGALASRNHIDSRTCGLDFLRLEPLEHLGRWHSRVLILT